MTLYFQMTIFWMGVFSTFYFFSAILHGLHLTNDDHNFQGWRGSLLRRNKFYHWAILLKLWAMKSNVLPCDSLFSRLLGSLFLLVKEEPVWRGSVRLRLPPRASTVAEPSRATIRQLRRLLSEPRRSQSHFLPCHSDLQDPTVSHQAEPELSWVAPNAP